MTCQLTWLVWDMIQVGTKASFPISGPYPSVASLDLNFGFIVKNTYIVNVIHTPKTRKWWEKLGFQFVLHFILRSSESYFGLLVLCISDLIPEAELIAHKST